MYSLCNLYLTLFFVLFGVCVCMCKCVFVFVLLHLDVDRIWDCLLWEGTIPLHRVGLAVCRLAEIDIGPHIDDADFSTLYAALNKPRHCLCELNTSLPSLKKLVPFLVFTKNI